MRALRKKFDVAVALSLTFSMAISHAFAGDCNFLRGSATLSDRELFYQIPGTSRWTKMDDLGAAFRNQSVKFAYVIVEDFAEARDGVLIIKSGRTRQANEPPLNRPTKSVKLVRVNEGFPNRGCGQPAPFGERRVSAQSYDAYHDRGLKVNGQDQTTLDSFHFKYAARRGCRMTNDPTADSYAVLDFRSNRSQFSFDPNVVREGTYSQVIAFFGVNTASAASETLANQRVETKQYHSLSHTPVCVVFNLTVSGAANFLRINDLEALKQWGNRYIRADEKSWALSQ